MVYSASLSWWGPLEDWGSRTPPSAPENDEMGRRKAVIRIEP